MQKEPPSFIQGIKNFFTDLFGITTQDSWDRYIPMSREEATEMLTRDMPRGTEIEFKLNSKGKGKVMMTGNNIYEERPFHLGEHVVNTGYMTISKQHKGIGRHIMRNEIEFFAACGANKYKIYAALEAGGYAWARFGFLPEYPSDLRSTITERFNRLRPMMKKKEVEVLKNILDFDNGKDAWNLADFPLDIAPRLRRVFEEATSGDKDAKKMRKELLKIPYVVEELYRKKALSKPQNLGRVLMAGSTWDGYLDFSDKEQMTRVEKYVGGWKKVNPNTATLAAG